MRIRQFDVGNLYPPKEKCFSTPVWVELIFLHHYYFIHERKVIFRFINGNRPKIIVREMYCVEGWMDGISKVSFNFVYPPKKQSVLAFLIGSK